MRDEPELTERERQVLQALIDSYIHAGEPVGSKAIAQLGLGVSPATVRSVLAVLDERGLVEQPHTSAGRVPTDRGFRYYVDTMLKVQPPSPAEADEIADIAGAGADGALKEAGRVLSRLARHTTVVISARHDGPPLKHVELLRLRDDAVLLILVQADGRVHNRILQWPEGVIGTPSAAELERLARRLTALVDGKTLQQARERLLAEIAAKRAELSEIEARLLQASASTMTAGADPTVLVEGTAHLLEADADLQRTKELLALLEEEERIEGVLSRAVDAPGVRIFIGQENAAAALVERGVVAVGIGPGGALGMLGVIGPRHLDYGRVVPLVDLTAHVVSRLLK